MASLTENITWEEGIYQIEQTDVVLGGADGISNLQQKQLANRTLWLRDQLGRYGGYKTVDTSTTLAAADLKKLIIGTGKVAITLPAIDATVPDGARCSVIAVCDADIKYITLLANSGNILAGKSSRPAIYLHDGESAVLANIGGQWRVTDFDGNLYKVGEEVKARTVFKNCITMQGQTLNRADYPRLWEYIQNAGSDVIVTDNTWLSDAVRYRGFFSTGNGSSTFRLPDERGMIDRGLDLGRGLDLYRLDAKPGGYETSDNEQHGHKANGNSNGDSGGSGGVMVSSFKGFEDINDTNTSGGVTKRFIEYSGSEARPKNIGKIPQIRF